MLGAITHIPPTNFSGGIMRNCVFTIVLTLLLGPALLAQGVPQSMAYQGYVTDLAGSPVADGNYSFTFALYTVESGGTALWQETHPTVAVTKGLFAVHLGRGNPAVPLTPLFDQQYFLGIKMGVDPEMTPRVRLSTSAYSFHARTADGVAPGSITDASVAAGANIAASKLQSSILTEAEVIAGSGITIDRAGGNLTINSSPGAVVLGGDVTGPAASNAIANGVVTAAKLAPNSVTGEKIMNDAVINVKIADNAVTAAKIAPNIVSSIAGVSNDGGDINLVAGANVTITPNDAANTITIAAAGGGGGGLTLPYAETGNTSGNLFAITQQGTGGRAAFFEIANTANVNEALYVKSNSTSASGFAVDIDAQAGIAMEAKNNSGSQPAINVYNSGAGPVAKFGNGGTSTGNIVEISKSGGAGKGLNVTYAGTTNAIFVDNNSSGVGLELKQDGTGNAAYFHIDNTSSSNNTLRATSASTSSSSDALEVVAVAGNALDATNNSTATATIWARNNNATANALALDVGGSGGNATIDREGDIVTDGNVTADGYLATLALGAAGTPPDGSIYKDNVIYGWGNITAAGSLAGTDEGYGITVSKTATGTFAITYKNSLTNGAAPMAIALEASAPQFAVISAISTTGCTVKIWRFSAGAFTLTDSQFFFIVTGRP